MIRERIIQNPKGRAEYRSKKKPPVKAATIPIFKVANEDKTIREINTKLGTHPAKEKWGKKLT